MKKIFFSLVAAMLTIGMYAQDAQEKTIVNTSFSTWEEYTTSTDKGDATTHVDSIIANSSKEHIVFTLYNTNVYTGGGGKVSAACNAPDKYLCAMKQNAGSESTITTSAISSVTTLSYFHRATGSSRGWGLRVKGDGDTDWVDVYTTTTNSTGANTGDIVVNRTNVQLQWYNLSVGNYAALTNLVIKGMVTDTRTFQDFELDMSAGNFDMSAANLPEGVSIGGSARSDNHGWDNFTAVIPVDGAVKFTWGGCEYGNLAVTVKNHAQQVLASFNVVKSCYHNNHASVTTWTYNSEDADTLYISGSQYLPYFKAEKTEYVPNIVITYRDQDEKLLGKDTIAPNLPFAPSYSAEDLTIADGMVFRGWVNAGGVKYNVGRTIGEDVELFALVTSIEQATVGSHYLYNLKSATFYPEDHELISANGTYKDGTHGWTFGNGKEMTLIVSPKSYVTVGLCTYTNTSDQIIRNAAGDSVSVMHVIRNGEEGAIADGTLCSFYYANANDAVDTLHFNFTTTSYIHSVEVYNVAAPLNKVGHTYDVAAGDAATFMMVCKILEDGDTIQLHDGIYDLGEVTLTTISANNVVVRGESMDGTIIKNAPGVKMESIDKTATLVNTGTGNVFELLTLQNALDYYSTSTGRAVCFQDKGTRTACYSVKMLSYQDTYYSNKPGQQCWFEDCEIHGTVDFICGSGSVYFYNTLLYCEKRKMDGSGQDCITANNSQTAQQDKGYVFDRCTIQSECPVISLGRAWNDQSQTAYLLTTLDMSAGNFALTDNSKIFRWTKEGMNVVAYDFAEYNTMDVDGNVISPASNSVAFFYKETTNTLETIIDYTAAEAKSYTHFFRDSWDPARNYVAFPAPATTAVENTEAAEAKVVKTIENGQIVIIKNGVRYNAMGAVIK